MTKIEEIRAERSTSKRLVTKRMKVKVKIDGQEVKDKIDPQPSGNEEINNERRCGKERDGAMERDRGRVEGGGGEEVGEKGT